MKPNDPHQPFDAEADFAEEDASTLTSEFWRGDRHWVSKSRQNGGRRPPPDNSEPVTGTVRAIKAGFAAFRPRTVEGAGRNDRSRDRTREHGIVRPGQQHSSEGSRRSSISAAVPLATREVSIAELAGEWLDEPMPHRAPTRSPRSDVSGPRPIRDEMADARRTTRQPVVAPLPVEDEVHGFGDDAYFDDHEIPLTAVASLSSRLGLGAVDPLLARVGAMVLVALMLVPLALAMRSGDKTPAAFGESVPPPAALSDTTAPPGAPASAAAAAAPADATQAASNLPDTMTETAALATPAATAVAAVASVADDATQATTAAVATTISAGDATDDDGALTNPAVVEEQAERIPCGDSYTIARNDSWYRIAGAADISMKDLLDVNMATTQTVLLVGADICLPQGASIAAPTTTAPTTTAPTTTTAAPTTAAPTTTAAPATTAVAIPNVTTAQVQQLIRDIFPDDQEAKALDVAFRESRYIATADNGTCCVGVFQLHWTAHRSWLDDFGIYTRNDLKNAEKNIRAAFALYQTSGWGPWGG